MLQMISQIKTINNFIFNFIVINSIQIINSYKQFNVTALIDFSSNSFPVGKDQAFIITAKHDIFVEINAFDQRFHIIAKTIDSNNENDVNTKIYFGRLYLKQDSYVIGYVKNHLFLGVIKVDEIRYNLEPITHFDENYSEKQSIAVMYRDDNIIFNGVKDRIDLILSHKITSKGRKFKSKHNSKNRLLAKNANINNLPKNKVCGLDLYADIHYTKRFGTLGAIAEMLITVREANAIFKKIDFDGDGVPDNIGVSAVKWTVYDPQKHDGIGLNKVEADGELLINRFQKRITNHCIQVLFTHQNLAISKTVISGLAKLKGVCAEPQKINGIRQSVNSVLVSSLSYDKVVNRVQRILDLTHQIGHSFGAGHEDTANQVSDFKNKLKFSRSSIEVMKKVLSYSKSNKCFIKRSEPICGDLEVDEGEECDAGAMQISTLADPCCEPTGSAKQCRIRKDIECHPSHGSCCDVKTCQFLHWKTFTVQCRVDCYEPAFCLGRSAQCPKSYPLKAGAKCSNCSSELCVCDHNGICLNRDEPKKTKTTEKSSTIPFPTKELESIRKIRFMRNIIFSILIGMIIIGSMALCWFNGCFDFIIDYFYQFYRNRRQDRLLDQELDEFYDYDTDEEHQYRH